MKTSGNHVGTIIAVIALSILALWSGVVMGVRKRVDEHHTRATRYLADHKCVTISYAGKDAEPVYQCDNGLVMRKQIP